MRQAGHLAAALLHHLEPMVQPGISTLKLNNEAERWTQLVYFGAAKREGSRTIARLSDRPSKPTDRPLKMLEGQQILQC